jgi:hypothetical protein
MRSSYVELFRVIVFRVPSLPMAAESAIESRGVSAEDSALIDGDSVPDLQILELHCFFQILHCALQITTEKREIAALTRGIQSTLVPRIQGNCDE